MIFVLSLLAQPALGLLPLMVQDAAGYWFYVFDGTFGLPGYASLAQLAFDPPSRC